MSELSDTKLIKIENEMIRNFKIFSELWTNNNDFIFNENFESELNRYFAAHHIVIELETEIEDGKKVMANMNIVKQKDESFYGLRFELGIPELNTSNNKYETDLDCWHFIWDSKTKDFKETINSMNEKNFNNFVDYFADIFLHLASATEDYIIENKKTDEEKKNDIEKEMTQVVDLFKI